MAPLFPSTIHSENIGGNDAASNRNIFLIRLFNWEYWPAWLTNIPVIIFWFLHAIRARHLGFFAAANPAIYSGGMLGEKKHEIMKLMPQEWLPKDLLFRISECIDADQLWQKIMAAGIEAPFICKPDVGERGLLVEKIHNKKDLEWYLQRCNVDFHVQEFVAYPEEYSVLYYLMPNGNEDGITSVCYKGYLKVIGDGKTDLRNLILQKPRAKLQLETLCKRPDLDMKYVPADGEEFVLVHIGNHARGTRFNNANHLADDALLRQFRDMTAQLDGVFFCRYDLKCQSIEHLRRGEAFKIVELNGVAAEPAHVYDPEYPVWKAYADMWRQWTLIYRIAKQNKAKGVPYMKLAEGWTAFKQHLKYNKTADRGV